MNDIHTALDEAVERFAALDRVLVATDFDGVLAPLVLDPAASRPQPGTIEALRTMSARPGVTVAVASGRDLATLGALTGLSNDERIVLIGSHGAESNVSLTAGGTAETGELSEAEASALAQARAAVDAISAATPGTSVEHKPAGVVLHTRGLGELDAATASQAAAAVPERIPGVHAMLGKSVVELSVLDASKGASLTALARSRGAQAMLYLGDDVTDETVFTRADTPADVTIKVGDGPSAARYRLPSCTDVPQLLGRLAQNMRRESATPLD